MVVTAQALTERQEAILRYLVQEHVGTAKPVASQILADSYNLEVSPATIRNEMAYLEELGYLNHPHTSAGREPTVEGYRYFVERLMAESNLSLVQRRTIRHQFHQARPDLEQWLKLAAAVLANTAHAAGWATAPQPVDPRLKHLELIHLGGLTILLIVVLEGGAVEQQLVTAPELFNQDQLARISNLLNDVLEGLTGDDIVQRQSAQLASENWVVDTVLEMMQGGAQGAWSDVHHEGLTHILREPEFAEREKAEVAIDLLERQDILEAILSEMTRSSSGVQVIIGGDGRWEEIQDFSLVLAFYGMSEEAIGALGVLGPRRMAYDCAVPAVRYVSELMTDLLEELYR